VDKDKTTEIAWMVVVVIMCQLAITRVISGFVVSSTDAEHQETISWVERSMNENKRMCGFANGMDKTAIRFSTLLERALRTTQQKTRDEKAKTCLFAPFQ